jgi:hypothetical protein
MDDRQREADRIEQLLEDLEALAPPPVWQRIEELLQRLTRLYGGGLARLLGHVGELGRLDGTLAARLGGDELLSSLLLVHDLHPWPAAERVRAALERVQPALRAQVGELALVSVEGEVARLRVVGEAPASASALSVERLLHRALADAAPEIARIEVEGLPTAPSPSPSSELVQIDLRRRPPAETPP